MCCESGSLLSKSSLSGLLVPNLIAGRYRRPERIENIFLAYANMLLKNSSDYLGL